MNLPQRQDITGLVLAGGRGTRMGGVEKGLQLLDGVPLAQHALRRLAPQVGTLMLNANRHLDAYAAFGVPVHPDDPIGADAFAGPLAGVLTGLRRCATPFLVTVPCDTPRFPLDLVARLAAGLAQGGADIAMAASPEQDDPAGLPKPQPVFCLIRRSVADSLARFMDAGGRKVGAWTANHSTIMVPFIDKAGGTAMFANANTLDELHQIEIETAHHTRF